MADGQKRENSLAKDDEEPASRAPFDHNKAWPTRTAGIFLLGRACPLRARPTLRSFIMPRSSVLTFPDGGAPTEKPHLQKIDSKVEEEEDGFKEVAISLLIDEGADEEDLDTKPSSVHDTDGGGGEESRVLRFDRGPRINEEGGGEYAIDGEDDANTDDDDDDSRRGGDGNGSRSINDDGSQSINDNGSQSINDSDDDDGGDDPSDDERLPQYPPIPPGFGMFPPPPPGYYPYYPPPHPHHYPYPPVPPPPGYYPPPPPGYYPPLPPGHMMPPAHPYYTGERDPSGVSSPPSTTGTSGNVVCLIMYPSSISFLLRFIPPHNPEPDPRRARLRRQAQSHTHQDHTGPDKPQAAKERPIPTPRRAPAR